MKLGILRFIQNSCAVTISGVHEKKRWILKVISDILYEKSMKNNSLIT